MSNKIKKIRKEKRISQIVLAKKAEIAQAYLSQIETGERIPSLKVLQRIATALDIKVSVIMEDESSVQGSVAQ